MALGIHQETFTEGIANLILYAIRSGYKVRFGDTYPSKKHSPEGQHPKGLAVDLHLFRNGEYLKNTTDHLPLGYYWESLNEDFRWGGRWEDGNHYESCPGWRTKK